MAAEAEAEAEVEVGATTSGVGSGVAIGLKLERLATAKAGSMLNGTGLNSLKGKGQVCQQAELKSL